MTTLPTRAIRDRCVACQVGQGRLCACRSQRRQRPRFEMSVTQFWWTVLIALTGFWAVVIWHTVEAFR